MPGFNSGASGFFFCLRVPRISLHSGQEKKELCASTEMSKICALCFETATEQIHSPSILWEHLCQHQHHHHPASSSLIASPAGGRGSVRTAVPTESHEERSSNRAGRFFKTFFFFFFFFFFFLEALQLLWWAASPGLSVREETMAQLLCGC